MSIQREPRNAVHKSAVAVVKETQSGTTSNAKRATHPNEIRVGTESCWLETKAHGFMGDKVHEVGRRLTQERLLLQESGSYQGSTIGLLLLAK